MNIQKLINQYEYEFKNADKGIHVNARFGVKWQLERNIRDLKILQKEQRGCISQIERHDEEESTNPYVYSYEIREKFGLDND